MDSQTTLVSVIEATFHEYFSQQSALEVVSLATSDGFNVVTLKRDYVDFENDKMAAAASTLYSVSDAVAKQILNKRFDVTFIETEAGNVAFVALGIAAKEYVLAMSANESMNIASLRLLLKRLAKEISN